PFGALDDPSQSEWYNACSLGKKYDYPYGNVWDASRCNGQDERGRLPQGPVAVGTTTCEGGYPSLFDMSGNVSEWEDSCNQDRCRVRGGAYTADQTGLKCGAARDLARSVGDPTVGVRCCGG